VSPPNKQTRRGRMSFNIRGHSPVGSVEATRSPKYLSHSPENKANDVTTDNDEPERNAEAPNTCKKCQHPSITSIPHPLAPLLVIVVDDLCGIQEK
jgi:hypothetical protein